MAGDYSKAATALRGKAVLADVDATVEESLAKRYNIEGFPTLKLFQNGEEVIDYTGDRDYDSMVKFIEGAKKPAYESVATASEYAAFAEENKGIDVVVGLGLDGAARLVLTKASFALRDLFPDSLAYLSLKDASASKDVAGLAKGDFALLRSGGGEVEAIKFDAKKHKSLESFVKTAAVPAFGEFSQENADLYTELTTPLIVGFFDRAAKDEDPNMAILKAVANKKKDNGKVVFVWVDAEKLASFKEYVGVQDASVPICGYAFVSDQRYMLPKGVAKLTEETFEAWVDDMIAGKVGPATKSQPIPARQGDSGPVTVVGDSWMSIVEDESKDVLIAQVAPWCGHCKSMKPALARAAGALRTAGVKNVVIAVMDATENDAPAAYKAKGFPTFHFFPAAKGAAGVTFEGQRTSKGFIDFLAENSVNSFTFDTSKLGEDPVAEEEAEAEAEAEAAGKDGAEVDDVIEEGEAGELDDEAPDNAARDDGGEKEEL
jgi:protein disulfide-isomerase A1